jgi:hypothetical protein
MRYIAAAKLHAKALQVLVVIEDAEKRIETFERYIRVHSASYANWREELAALPLGKQPIEPMQRQVDITKAAHARLRGYYKNILSRLNELK